ncbi:VLRF1 family aeRF1-type release factor [Paenibacillus senegalensis]|uniref:VLRF1 family aeRF1-type release factor n=1 Tax=Paenibacillus senegalensis TaxID=1465766 RepID=UPI00028931A2|nr:VLRF1 family aeRF1-type release factor [Paenibacillus senegalensis]
MHLKKEIENIQSFAPNPKELILTIYLDTRPDSSQKSAWQIRLKNGLKKLMEYAEAEGNSDRISQLRKLQQEVLKEMEGQRHSVKNGWIVIASPSKQAWFNQQVQVPVPNAFYWEQEPHLDELTQTIQTYPAAGAVLLGKEKVTVLDTFLGLVQQEWNFEWNPDLEDWGEMKGLAHSNRVASGSNHIDNFEKRYEHNQQRWLNRLSSVLSRLSKRYQWKELIMSGEKNLTRETAKAIKTPVPRVLSKNYNGKPAQKLLQEVYTAIQS